MAKIQFTPDLRKLIAETTGLTYLAYNLEKYDDSDGKIVSSILGYYAPQAHMRTVVEDIVIPAIKKEVPALELKLPNPITGEVEADDTETPNTKVLFSIVAIPADAKIVINSVERSSIEVEPGTEVAWYVEKDGYVTATGVKTITAETVEEVTLVSAEVDKILPTITGGTNPMPSTAPVNTPIECTTATTTGDYAGTMVYSTCKVEPVDGVSIEYKEGNNFLPLPMPENGEFVFGDPNTGFPLANTESVLRVTVANPGTYSVTTTLRAINNEFTPISSVATVVIEAAQEPFAEPSVDTITEPVTESAAETTTTKAKAKSSKK